MPARRSEPILRARGLLSAGVLSTALSSSGPPSIPRASAALRLGVVSWEMLPIRRVWDLGSPASEEERADVGWESQLQVGRDPFQRCEAPLYISGGGGRRPGSEGLKVAGHPDPSCILLRGHFLSIWGPRPRGQLTTRPGLGVMLGEVTHAPRIRHQGLEQRVGDSRFKRTRPLGSDSPAPLLGSQCLSGVCIPGLGGHSQE